METFVCRAAAAAALLLAATTGPLSAQTAVEGPVPFDTFVAGLSRPAAGALAAGPGGTAPTAVAAAEMRQHLLRQYSGIAVAHSFAQDGQTFDCVPVAQQPGVRLQGLTSIAAPPPVPPAIRGGGGPRTVPATQDSAGKFDAAGNAQTCEPGTIPMRRVTLQEIARFGDLRTFLAKGPNGAGQIRVPRNDGTTPPSFGGHSYAHEYKYVTNYGGYSILSLYRPYVNQWLSEVFSLSQQWYVGGGGAATQTAEVGLQNYPAKYGSENSALFIYWTADNYTHTGCYNLDCAAFVQTSGAYHLGGTFSAYSTVGGAQYDLALGFYLYNGNWWLWVGNGWLGYYPGSIYRGGQLAHYAQIFDMGGETVGSWFWPPMGSGQWASAGWPRAAYHRTIAYRTAADAFVAPSLTVSQPFPSCYTASAPTWGGSTWQTYFFFGGPGGTTC